MIVNAIINSITHASRTETRKPGVGSDSKSKPSGGPRQWVNGPRRKLRDCFSPQGLPTAFRSSSTAHDTPHQLTSSPLPPYYHQLPPRWTPSSSQDTPRAFSAWSLFLLPPPAGQLTLSHMVLQGLPSGECFLTHPSDSAAPVLCSRCNPRQHRALLCTYIAGYPAHPPLF